MIPIYIVSLKSDHERRRKISHLLEKNKIKYTFIDAIYGKDLSQEELDSLKLYTVESRLKRKLGKGEIGCTLSHLNVYEEILKKDHKWACILEDDVILDVNFLRFVENFNSNTLEISDSIFILGGQDGLIQSRYIARSHFYKKNIGTINFDKTISSFDDIFRTCCYLVNSRVAKNLLQLSKQEFFVADDWAYFRKNKIIKDIYLSDLVSHPEDLSESHLELERENIFIKNKNSNPFLIKLKWAVKHRAKLLARFFKEFSL